MAHWDKNVLLPEEPKPSMETLLTLLKKVDAKLDTIIENTTPSQEEDDS